MTAVDTNVLIFAALPPDVRRWLCLAVSNSLQLFWGYAPVSGGIAAKITKVRFSERHSLSAHLAAEPQKTFLNVTFIS